MLQILPLRCRLLLLLAVFYLAWLPAEAQKEKHTIPLIVTIFNNATLLPGGGELGIFGIPVHPGFSVGMEFRYNYHPRNEWFQTVKLGYHYHQYVQHSLQLYSELGYRYNFKGQFDLGSRLGLGYLHSFPDMQIFELEEGGYQKKTNWGRPQGTVSLAVEIGFEISKRKDNPVRLFTAYQFYLQMPFVPEYVPLVPNTALHLGTAIPL